jgi:hypothetical protein
VGVEPCYAGRHAVGRHGLQAGERAQAAVAVAGEHEGEAAGSRGLCDRGGQSRGDSGRRLRFALHPLQLGADRGNVDAVAELDQVVSRSRCEIA